MLPREESTLVGRDIPGQNRWFAFAPVVESLIPEG
jgi:hypothetical protein